MKNIFFKFILSLAVCMVFVGCEAPNDGALDSSIDNGSNIGKGIGKISIKLGAIPDFASRSEEEPDPDKEAPLIPLDDFYICIYDDAGVIKIKGLYGNLDPVLGLPIGTDYKITAEAGVNSIAAFDSPYYYGESIFEVVEDLVNTVAIEAKVANTKVTIKMTDEFRAEYGTDWGITIRNEYYHADGDPELVYNSTNEEDEGWMRPSTLLVRVRARTVIKTYQVESVTAAQHYIFSLVLAESGKINLYFVLDNSLNDIDKPIDVPTDDETLGNGGIELPDYPGGGDPDPELPAAPSIKGDGFNIDETLTIDKAQEIPPVIGVINAPGLIKEFHVTINSSPGINAMLPTLFGGNSFDMANPTTLQKTSLISLGLLQDGVPIKGATSAVLDVTLFMGLLDGNSGLAHEFAIRIVDNEDQTIGKTLSVIIIEEVEE